MSLREGDPLTSRGRARFREMLWMLAMDKEGEGGSAKKNRSRTTGYCIRAMDVALLHNHQFENLSDRSPARTNSRRYTNGGGKAPCC